MVHERRQERLIVPDAVDDGAVERLRHGVDRALRSGPWVTSLAISGSK